MRIVKDESGRGKSSMETGRMCHRLWFMNIFSVILIIVVMAFISCRHHKLWVFAVTAGAGMLELFLFEILVKLILSFRRMTEAVEDVGERVGRLEETVKRKR